MGFELQVIKTILPNCDSINSVLASFRCGLLELSTNEKQTLGEILPVLDIFFFIKNVLGNKLLYKMKTSRDRPKSAPYPRLKNSKKTSKCQVFSFTVLENRKICEKNFSKKLHTEKNEPSGAPGPASASPWRAKVSQCRKTERGTL